MANSPRSTPIDICETTTYFFLSVFFFFVREEFNKMCVLLDKHRKEIRDGRGLMRGGRGGREMNKIEGEEILKSEVFRPAWVQPSWVRMGTYDIDKVVGL